MKKWLVLLTAAVWVFTLAACGGKTPPADGGESTPSTTVTTVTHNLSDEMSSVDKIDTVGNGCIGFMQIEINPSFELYVKMNEETGELTVVYARPTNADAKALFTKVAVANKTLWDALYAICDAAKADGYLQAGDSLKIDCFGQSQRYGIADSVKQILDAYQQEKAIFLSYNVTSTESDDANNGEGEGGEIDPMLYDEVEYDPNGNVIKTVLINREDNCVETKHYDASGALITEIFEDKNFEQTHETHYQNGKVVKQVHILTEETTTETFDESGRKTAQIIESATDNSRSEQYWTYYADGSVASLIGKLTNSTYPQGYYKEEQYYQSGAVSMSHELSQYGDNKYYYDANGNKTKYEGKNNLGERVEIVYHADGSHTDTIHEASGKIRVETWGADGSLTVTYLP